MLSGISESLGSLQKMDQWVNNCLVVCHEQQHKNFMAPVIYKIN